MRRIVMSIRFARNLRKTQTVAEKVLWFQLRNRRFSGFKFRRQRPIGPYIVDFCCLEKKIIIELDGGQHASQVAYDNSRTHFLESEDYRVLRFWDNETITNTDVVMDVIWNALNQ